MTQPGSGALSPPAPGVSRRGSLKTMSGGALAALAAAPIAKASKSEKKANRRARKKGKKKCRKQDGQCISAFVELCADQEEPDVCEALFNSCCPFLAQCQTSAFFDCLFAKGG
jgi:hypothetical protein